LFEHDLFETGSRFPDHALDRKARAIIARAFLLSITDKLRPLQRAMASKLSKTCENSTYRLADSVIAESSHAGGDQAPRQGKYF
jgi:hypothetical protein